MLFSLYQRFRIIVFTILSLMVFVFNCSDDDSDDDEIKELLTTGTWELSEESDQGLIGARWQFNSDGSAVVYYEGSVFFEFQWRLEDNNTTLVFTFSNDSDSFEIEKLTEIDLVLMDPESEGKLIFFKVTD